MRHETIIAAAIGGAVEEGRKHLGALLAAQVTQRQAGGHKDRRRLAQELVDAEEAELDRIARRVEVSRAELIQMIQEDDRRPRGGRGAPAARRNTLEAAAVRLLAANQRLATAVQASVAADLEYVDAKRAQAEASHAHRQLVAKSPVRA